MTHDGVRILNYVGWGGRREQAVAEVDLGFGIKRKPTAPYGLRRAAYDLAFGYVNGFKPSAIAYYVLTRSLSQRIWHYAYFREHPDAPYGCGGQGDLRPNKPDVLWCRICYPKGEPR